MTTATTIEEALTLRPEEGAWVGNVAEGFDVFGIPHGGYLAALAAQALLQATKAPDIFSLTIHYVRKAEFGPIRFEVSPGGKSRRFGSWRATARQGEAVIMEVSGLVGDRSSIQGPTRASAPAWASDKASFLGSSSEGAASSFPQPAVAIKFGVDIHEDDLGFAKGKTGGEARVRYRMHGDAGVLAAIVGCDGGPPAIWNAEGMTGWVPTVELTIHVRGRPEPGPLYAEAISEQLADGFMEEDALVWDASGRLIVQSRQLARFSEMKG